MQIMMPRVNDVSRIQSEHQQGNLAAQQSKARTIDKQYEKNMKQVNTRKNDEKTIIKDKQHKSKDQSNKKDNGENTDTKKEKDNKKLNEAAESGRTIDIRL